MKKRTLEESIKENQTIINQIKILDNKRMIELFDIDEETINLIFIKYDINLKFETLKEIAKDIKINTKLNLKHNQILNILSKELGYKNYHSLVSSIRNKEVV
jgi:hypothetical protein